MPRNPNKTRCSVPGCRAWAIRGSDPPLCSPHRHSTDIPGPALREAAGPAATVAIGCTVGEPAQGTGSAHSPGVGAPPGNKNRIVHGFYSTVLRPEERADLLAHAADATLDAEIAIMRVALRRILGMLLTGLTPGPEPAPLNAQDYARFAGLAFQGASAISRLLRARQALSEDTDPLSEAMYQALKEVGEELGVDLVGT